MNLQRRTILITAAAIITVLIVIIAILIATRPAQPVNTAPPTTTGEPTTPTQTATGVPPETPEDIAVEAFNAFYADKTAKACKYFTTDAYRWQRARENLPDLRFPMKKYCDEGESYVQGKPYRTAFSVAITRSEGDAIQVGLIGKGGTGHVGVSLIPVGDSWEIERWCNYHVEGMEPMTEIVTCLDGDSDA